MFSRMARQATINVRRFSHEAETQLETWIKINDRMHIDAALKAEAAVSGVKADVAVLRGEVKIDVATLRTEVGSLKNDVGQVKTDVNELRKGQVEIHKEISAIHREVSRLHNQSSNQTRLILAGGATIASAFFAANQYIEYTKSKSISQPAVK